MIIHDIKVAETKPLPAPQRGDDDPRFWDRAKKALQSLAPEGTSRPRDAEILLGLGAAVWLEYFQKCGPNPKNDWHRASLGLGPTHVGPTVCRGLYVNCLPRVTPCKKF